MNSVNRNSLFMRKLGFTVRAEIRASAETNCCYCGLAHEETLWVRCPARRTHASEPTLTAFGLAAKRRAECVSVNLSGYLAFHNVTDCCCRCCYSLRVRIHGEVRRVRFSWSLDPSPRQPTAAWPRRDAPPADRTLGT